MSGLSTIQQFVLVAHPRSGSTWLAHGLGEHDDILMFGEVFNADRDDRARGVWEGLRYETYLSHHPDAYAPPASTAEFAKQLFNLAEVTEHKAVGFKIHYEHAWGNRIWNSVWRLIEADPSIAIIHLYRTDLLRSYVSMLIADTKNEWVATKRHPGGERGAARVHVDIPSFRVFARQCLRARTLLERYRNNRPFLDLAYENSIASHPAEAYHAICDVLGQSRTNPHNYYIRQKQFAIEEVVINYADALACWQDVATTPP